MQEEKKVKPANYHHTGYEQRMASFNSHPQSPENMPPQLMAKVSLSYSEEQFKNNPLIDKESFPSKDSVLFLGDKYAPSLLKIASNNKPIVDFPISDVAHALLFSAITAEKVEASKTVYPILVIQHNGRWRVLDGFNRLAKAALNGRTKIHARVMTHDDIKSCKVS